MGSLQRPTGWQAEVQNGYGTAVWKGPTFGTDDATWGATLERIMDDERVK